MMRAKIGSPTTTENGIKLDRLKKTTKILKQRLKLIHQCKEMPSGLFSTKNINPGAAGLAEDLT
jgi:hypothetical protein